eukprot:CAMPEP_0171315488 /NCGR_PEP_ID=MMETSP0816-20121228/64496_1 /TAXON_ID=420281 /ORGANISM="Proboscia inermis, Strain CCAP1064/1" /LENGTH=49 /DNA_ID= /DNA_START= /DNA_END= /DNA_ORIENTATION=
MIGTGILALVTFPPDDCVSPDNSSMKSVTDLTSADIAAISSGVRELRSI